ncbi:MAG: diguanylate cyclase [Actinomycetota bacterium]|nr:diguanylate cyclase [Actinomycetota bacterium]
MGTTRLPLPAPVANHLTSGLTSRLILTYVERERGRAGVDALLREADLNVPEDQLRDETFWFDFQTKVALFEAAKEVLEDPQAARHIGAAAIEINVFPGLKLALRTIGSPRMLYAQIPRIARKFTWAHAFEILELSDAFARMAYADVADVGYHQVDCDYNVGILSSVTTLFERRPAQVRHGECALQGASRCVYDFSWDDPSTVLSHAAKWLTASVVGGSLVHVARPRALPATAVVPAMGAVSVARRAWAARRQRRRSLEVELRDQRDAAQRLAASLREMVSDLRIEEVLANIVANAQTAATGRDFALLISEGRAFHCRRSSRVPSDMLTALEAWAAGHPAALRGPLTLDDIGGVPELERLVDDTRLPVGTLHAVPLFFRTSTLGVLIALGHGSDPFVAHEKAALDAYAAQAAIALANARLFERLEELAKRDSLTSLFNHAQFHDTLDRELDRADRYGHSVSVIMLDLDSFKKLNDEFGHAEGDRVLKEVATTLQAACGDSDSAYRLGGDELAVVMPLASAAHAKAMARGIARAVVELEVGVTISYGVGEWPQDGPSKSLLLFNADRALYSAKPESPAPAGKRSRPERRPDAGEEEGEDLWGDRTDRQLRSVTNALARAVDAKDSYTRSHSETVAQLCALIGKELGFQGAGLEQLQLAGLLHDVGKIGIADAILQKPSRLTAAEYEVMKTHTRLGHKIVCGAELEQEAGWILHHHEQPDGRGYPEGLQGEKVPLESRVILVADAFEAITSDRPYRKGRPVGDALAELERYAGTQFDPRCVDALRKTLSRGARSLFEDTSSVPARS